jgi:hypothetical protein
MVVTKMIQLDKVQKIDALIQSLDSLKEKFSQNSMNVPHSALQQKSQPKTPAAPVSESADQKKSPEIEKNVVRDVQQQPDQKVIATSPSYHEDSQKAHPPISIEIIKTQWPHIIEEIKKRKIALGSFLNEGWPENIDGNELIIAFGMENGFHISSINRNRKSIEEIIREVVGVPLQIKCMQAEAPSADNSNGSNGSSYVEKLGQKIPLIKTIIDEFDGELVK